LQARDKAFIAPLGGRYGRRVGDFSTAAAVGAATAEYLACSNPAASRLCRLVEGFMRQRKSLEVLAVIASPYFVPVCFAVYLALRFALIVCLPLQPASDEQWYYHEAISIAAGRGYSEDHTSTAYWPVGWPGFLGLVFRLFGPSIFVGQLANLLCSAAIFVLTLRLGATLFKDELVGRLSVLILTIFPNQIAYVPNLSTEIFYTAMLLLAIDLLVSGEGWWRWIVSGVAFGVATLTKAQTLLLPATLLAVWWIGSGRERRSSYQVARALVVCAAMAAVILPWTARNYRAFGEIVPISTNGGLALITGNNPSAQGGFTPNDPLVKEVPRGVAQQVAADHLAQSLALAWIREHPGAAIALIPKKIWRLWAPDGEAEWSYQAGYQHYAEHWMIFRAVRIVNQVYYATLILLTVLSVIYWYRGASIPFLACSTGLVIIAYTTLVSVISYGFSRYHFPAIPWIAMYAAWAIVQSIGVSRSVVRVAA
jgi:4-amino-4-deoxy-L-arabinose transferase-like glycosyltransferase